jgi:hypothetical protein
MEKKTFALVQGFCHDKWHWHLLQAELENQGHPTIVMDLPLSSPNSTFDTYAEIIADTLKDRQNVTGVFHSRAGNYGPRAVNLLQARYPGRVIVSSMVFLSSSFENDTLHALGRPSPDEKTPPRNSPESRKAIIDRKDLGENMKAISPELAHEFLYHDVEDEALVTAAVAHLVPQNRPANEPTLHSWPGVSQHYIYCEDDRMVSPDWSQYVAENWLGIQPLHIPGGHSPFLSRPRTLADTLINLPS